MSAQPQLAPVITGPDGVELGVAGGLEAPHSPDCERALIGAVLADETPASWALACNVGVKVAAFFDVGRREIWAALDRLHRGGTGGIDVAILAEELRAAGKLEDPVGGFAGLAAATERGMSTGAKFFAEQLVLLWHRRWAMVMAAKLREAALTMGTREEFVEAAGGVGQRLIRLGRRESTRTLAEIYDDVRTEAQARIEGRIDRSGWITSGLEKFDRACKEFGSAREDHFVIFAGGSGHGKSVALRNIAGANLRKGKRVLSYSRETSTAGFVEMLVAAEMGVDLNTLDWLPRDRAEKFYAEFERQRNEWAGKLLFCVQHEPATPLMTVEDICDHARAFVHLRGVPDLILVDYLQLFEARKRITGNSRESLVAYVSHQLQALQRELGCVMVSAAQLNEAGLNEMRQVRRDEDGRVIHRMPKPGDLRESQGAYHDADRVIFLYKPPVDCRNQDQTAAGTSMPEVWWYQEKRRRGCAGLFVRCWFQKRFTRFVEMGAEDESEAERQAAGARVVPKGQRISKDQFKKGTT
jgi:replicative DNA helicase